MKLKKLLLMISIVLWTSAVCGYGYYRYHQTVEAENLKVAQQQEEQRKADELNQAAATAAQTAQPAPASTKPTTKTTPTYKGGITPIDTTYTPYKDTYDYSYHPTTTTTAPVGPTPAQLEAERQQRIHSCLIQVSNAGGGSSSAAEQCYSIQ